MLFPRRSLARCGRAWRIGRPRSGGTPWASPHRWARLLPAYSAPRAPLFLFPRGRLAVAARGAFPHRWALRIMLPPCTRDEPARRVACWGRAVGAPCLEAAGRHLSHHALLPPLLGPHRWQTAPSTGPAHEPACHLAANKRLLQQSDETPPCAPCSPVHPRTKRPAILGPAALELAPHCTMLGCQPASGVEPVGNRQTRTARPAPSSPTSLVR